VNPFVPEMTFKGHSRSSAMSSFVKSLGLSIRERNSKLPLVSDKNSLHNLEGRLRSSAMPQFNRPLATVSQWYVVVICLCCFVSDIFNVD